MSNYNDEFLVETSDKSSFVIEWDGTINGGDIQKKLKALEMLVDDERKYQVEFRLTERK